MMQQLEGAVHRLRNPMNGQQAKTALKRNGREIVLGENIAEGPEAVAQNQARRFHDDLGGQRRSEGLVMQRVARIR